MKRLKLVAQALKPSSIAKGIEAARNPPSQAEIDAALAQMPPEARARHQENLDRIERTQAEARAAAENAARERRVLEGPAGQALYGPNPYQVGTPDEPAAHARHGEGLGTVQDHIDLQKGMFKQALKETFGRADPPQIAEPAARAQQGAHERAARDAARAPYRSPHAAQVEILRLATRGKSQVQDVLKYLNGSSLATERIFGVYRVPDRISQTLTPASEKGRPVEWDIVHSPGAAAPRQLVVTSFKADELWVAKRIGEPSVLDEDLALAFCLGAGIGPEHCAGLARVCDFRALKGSGAGETDTATPIRTLVRGIVAFHPHDGSSTYERMRSGAPLHLGSPADVQIEVLNWAAIASAVRTKIYHPPPVPSPFPYLPATPQELLQAYLEVVGVQPGDCYSAQATVHRPRALQQSGVMTSNLGPKQPCADGKDRMRVHGGEHVVIVYRDRADYAAGRERWDAYQRDVLQGDLRRGLNLRPPVENPDDTMGVPRFLHRVLETAEFISRFHPDNWFDEESEVVNPHRYCWPPVK